MIIQKIVTVDFCGTRECTASLFVVKGIFKGVYVEIYPGTAFFNGERLPLGYKFGKVLQWPCKDVADFMYKRMNNLFPELKEEEILQLQKEEYEEKRKKEEGREEKARKEREIVDKYLQLFDVPEEERYYIGS
jgi:hypothetical protein